MNELSDFFKKLDRLEKVYTTMPRTAGIIAINFSKERFRAQNWVDASTQPWAKRQKNGKKRRKNSSRALLVKTGRLRRSVRIVRTGRDYIVIGSDVPYARAHNEGFEGSVTSHSQKGKSFTKKLKIPKRQYLGKSIVLERQIQEQITADIIKAIK